METEIQVFEDRKTKGHFVGAGVARIEVLLRLSTVIFRF